MVFILENDPARRSGLAKAH